MEFEYHFHYTTFSLSVYHKKTIEVGYLGKRTAHEMKSDPKFHKQAQTGKHQHTDTATPYKQQIPRTSVHIIQPHNAQDIYNYVFTVIVHDCLNEVIVTIMMHAIHLYKCKQHTKFECYMYLYIPNMYTYTCMWHVDFHANIICTSSSDQWNLELSNVCLYFRRNKMLWICFTHKIIPSENPMHTV